MSIINDALKKAQNQLSKSGNNPSADPGLPQKLATTPAQNTPAQNAPANNIQEAPDEFIQKNLQHIDQKKKENVEESLIESRQMERQDLQKQTEGTKPEKTVAPLDLKGVAVLILCFLVISGSIYYLLIGRKDGRSRRQTLRSLQRPFQKLQTSFKMPTRIVRISTSKAQPSASDQARPFMATPVQSAQSGSGLNLSGIVEMQGRRVALINGEIYEVGDSVQGRKIVDISLDKVEIEENGEIVTLTVEQ
ncbi:MAG: hypothetical protein A2Z88_05935 [Omnitrophica WOR_2 bacterium GWA2_47_8]|nr:MAG: hypothetical protein A2Z88_05935 [Omnitrophica WOR_2 bacterium GWA2_47_8]